MCEFLSHVQFFVTLWTIARQAPLSMGFPRQGYWSGLPFPSPGDLPDPRIKPMPPVLAGRFFTTEPPAKPIYLSIIKQWEVNLWEVNSIPNLYLLI